MLACHSDQLRFFSLQNSRLLAILAFFALSFALPLVAPSISAADTDVSPNLIVEQERWPNGALKSEWRVMRLHDGSTAKHGPEIHLFENGAIEYEGQWNEGKKAGLWEWFYESGAKRGEGAYDQDGYRTGKWKVWRENGQLSHEADYSSPNPFGRVPDYYDENGKKFVHPLKLTTKAMSFHGGIHADFGNLFADIAKGIVLLPVTIPKAAAESAMDETKEYLKHPVQKVGDNLIKLKDGAAWIGETAVIVIKDLWPF